MQRELKRTDLSRDEKYALFKGWLSHTDERVNILAIEERLDVSTLCQKWSRDGNTTWENACDRATGKMMARGEILDPVVAALIGEHIFWHMTRDGRTWEAVKIRTSVAMPESLKGAMDGFIAWVHEASAKDLRGLNDLKNNYNGTAKTLQRLATQHTPLAANIEDIKKAGLWVEDTLWTIAANPHLGAEAHEAAGKWLLERGAEAAAQNKTMLHETNFFIGSALQGGEASGEHKSFVQSAAAREGDVARWARSMASAIGEEADDKSGTMIVTAKGQKWVKALHSLTGSPNVHKEALTDILNLVHPSRLEGVSWQDLLPLLDNEYAPLRVLGARLAAEAEKTKVSPANSMAQRPGTLNR